MWIARDKDGDLYVYNKKPRKLYKVWAVEGNDYKSYEIEHDWDGFFSNIKWEDDEPTEIILKK